MQVADSGAAETPSLVAGPSWEPQETKQRAGSATVSPVQPFQGDGEVLSRLRPDASPGRGCHRFLLLWVSPRCRSLLSLFLLLPLSQAWSVAPLPVSCNEPQHSRGPRRSSPTSEFTRCQETSGEPVKPSLFRLRGGWFYCPVSQFCHPLGSFAWGMVFCCLHSPEAPGFHHPGTVPAQPW